MERDKYNVPTDKSEERAARERWEGGGRGSKME